MEYPLIYGMYLTWFYPKEKQIQQTKSLILTLLRETRGSYACMEASSPYLTREELQALVNAAYPNLMEGVFNKALAELPYDKEAKRFGYKSPLSPGISYYFVGSEGEIKSTWCHVRPFSSQ